MSLSQINLEKILSRIIITLTLDRAKYIARALIVPNKTNWLFKNPQNFREKTKGEQFCKFELKKLTFLSC